MTNFHDNTTLAQWRASFMLALGHRVVLIFEPALFSQCLHMRHENIDHRFFFYLFFYVSALVASVWDIFHQIVTPLWQFKHLHPSIPLAHHYIMQAKNLAPTSFLSPNTDCHCKMQCVIHYSLYGSKILSYSLDWPSSQ